MNHHTRGKLLKFLTQTRKLQGIGNLAAAENALRKALEASPDSIEVLQTAARFYSREVKDSAKAAHYASACRDRAAQIIAEMDEILGRRKQPTARHIGGIIGPY
jgi:uncharacterized protein HemY